MKNEVASSNARTPSAPPPAGAPLNRPTAAAPFSYRQFLVVVLLLIVTASIYSRTLGNGFIDYDDNIYVTENRNVQKGLTAQSMAWACGAVVAANWHPLTLLSHMTDVQFFGLRPGWHHAVNVMFHLLNVALLVSLLNRMTARFWPSLAVTALFALHPMHVESVAWISERKDVLSWMLGLLTLHAYVSFVRDRSARRYAMTVALFALGLLAKPMLVTLPCVMVLLDYWPLRRFGAESAKRIVVEKLPLLAISLASSIVTVIAQHRGGAVATFENAPMMLRLTNTAVSYLRYVGKLFWPTNLVPFHPQPGRWDLALVAMAIVFLLAISALAISLRRSRPYLLVGWLWYLGTMVPVIGLLRVGGHSIADRYAYIPYIGLYVMVVWTVADGVAGFRPHARVRTVAAVMVILALGAVTWHQIGHWRDSFTLFSHTLDCTRNNPVADDIVGGIYLERGNLDQAEFHLRRALQFDPENPETLSDLGVIFAARQDYDNALIEFKESLRIDPQNAKTRYNLGRLYGAQSKPEQAIAEFSRAVERDPEMGLAQFELGAALALQNRLEPAADHLKRAVKLMPRHADAQKYLAITLHQLGGVAEAVPHYEAARELSTDDVRVLITLAWIRATANDARLRDGAKSIQYAEHARDVTQSKDAGVFNVLGAAYAEAGRFEEAITAQEKAVEMARSAGQPGIAEEFATRLELYRDHQPARQ